MGGSTLTFVAAVRRFYEEVFNKKNVAAIDDFLAPMASITLCLPACQAVSRVPTIHRIYLAAFPDLHFTIEEIVAPSPCT
jgi:hypothetical protein